MQLQGDLYTYDTNDPRFEHQLVAGRNHLRRIVQIAADITNKPLRSLRVLDLACLEGLYGLEFARHGPLCSKEERRTSRRLASRRKRSG